jgi:hypothetical protein
MSGCINWTTLARIFVAALGLMGGGLFAGKALLRWCASPAQVVISIPLLAAPPRRVRRAISGGLRQPEQKLIAALFVVASLVSHDSEDST